MRIIKPFDPWQGKWCSCPAKYTLDPPVVPIAAFIVILLLLSPGFRGAEKNLVS